MKATLDIPDDLFREAKSRAALTGVRLEDLVADGLRLVPSGADARIAPKRVQFPIIKAKRGDPVLTKRMVDEAERQMAREEAERLDVPFHKRAWA